jgi:hypothetical protein
MGTMSRVGRLRRVRDRSRSVAAAVYLGRLEGEAGQAGFARQGPRPII